MTSSMAATRIFRFGNSSAFRGLIRSHLNPTTSGATAVPVVTADLINGAAEMQRPFETSNGNQLLFPIRSDGGILFGNQIGAFPGVNQSPLLARGDPVRIDDELDEDDGDDFDSDADEFDSDEDDADFEVEDFDGGEDDGDEDPGYKKRESKF